MHSQRSLLALSLLFSIGKASEKSPRPMTRRGLVILLLGIGIALDLLISVALFYAVHRAQTAASEVHIVKVAAYEACLVSNDQKAADLRRWNDILTLIRDSPVTPQRDLFIGAVNKANTQADSPRDCGELVP